MLAIDQRVSLETMFLDAGRPPATEALDAFRADVLRVLGPSASAVLVERGLVERGRFPALGDPSGGPPPGRILAGERLVQERGHSATGSSVDPDAPAIAARIGAQALKLMAVADLRAPLEPVTELVRSFVAMTGAAGLIAVVEGIVRGPDGVSPDAFLRVTARLAEEADLYKAQTPIFGGTDEASITALSREVSAAVACPWVVLSTGVAEHAYPAAVAAACRGGASGFLAGRGIWGAAVSADDPGAALGGPSLARLRELTAIVAAEARPWQDVPGASRR
jgi:sulfofructosephosphate aldolase